MNKLKVLALCDYQADFLAHTILTGLWEVPNVDIYEMPILQSVRGRVDEGYDLPGNPGGGMTGCTGYLQPAPLPEQSHTVEEVLANLATNSFDLIVATSTRDYVRHSLDLLTTIGWDISSKLVICDGEDHNYIDRDTIRQYKPRVFFKREMTREYSIPFYWSAYGLPVMPLPFGAFTRSLPKIDDGVKGRDLFVSLGRTNVIRDRFLSACLDAVYEKKVCHPDNAWLATNNNSPLVIQHKYGKELHDLSPWTEYMIRQGTAKIGASVIGFGRDCLHAWELFSFATFALYQDPELHIPHPFQDGIHCRYIKEEDFHLLPRFLEELLRNDEYRMWAANAGRDHCHHYHSTKARAEYLVDVAMKVIGGEKLRLSNYGL